MFSKSVLIAAFTSVVLLSGCDDAFDPRAPLQNQIVIFAVLSTDRDMQFVRVQADYMPPNFNPLSYTNDNFLNDAGVSIIAPNTTYQLRDTILTRGDTSRYTFPIRTFYQSQFTPIRGKKYQVVVRSASYGQAIASIIVPDGAKISFGEGSQNVVDRPDKSLQAAPILFLIQLSSNAKGYLTRFLLYYDVLKGSQWVEERVEIPTTSADSSNFSLNIPVYPQIIVAPGTSQIGLFYKNGYYKAIVNVVNEQYKNTKVIFKWATMVVLQADRNLYDYYSVTHAGRDPFSIRLDEPMISYVNGGIGMAGAYSLDSLVEILPEKFWGNR
jgi:hypothetical protein